MDEEIEGSVDIDPSEADSFVSQDSTSKSTNQRSKPNIFSDDYVDDEDDESSDSEDESDDFESDSDEDFESSIEDDEEDEEEIELKAKKPEKVEEPKKKDRSANARIRQLNEQKNEARRWANEQVQNAKQEIASYQQWANQMQQQHHQLREQLVVAQKELELIRQQSSLQDEEKLDPVERFRRQAVREAEELVSKKFQERFDQQESRITEMLEAQKREKEEGERKQRINGYREATSLAVDSILKGVSPEKSAPMKTLLESHVLNLAAARNILPAQAAKEFARVAHAFVKASTEKQAKANVEKLQKSKQLPVTQTNNRKPGKGKSRVSYKEAVKHGFRDALDWRSSNG